MIAGGGLSSGGELASLGDDFDDLRGLSSSGDGPTGEVDGGTGATALLSPVSLVPWYDY